MIGIAIAIKKMIIAKQHNFLSVILADINAKNKKGLNDMIKSRIEEVFSYSNISLFKLKSIF